MGEAILVGRGGSGSKAEFVTEIITTNTTWIAPNALNQAFSIRLFGGGSGAPAYGEICAGGAGGFMNHGIIYIPHGVSIPITIGAGGVSSRASNNTRSNGGMTSFGTYLSAAGGYLKDYTNSNAWANTALGGSTGGSAGNRSSDYTPTISGHAAQFGGGGNGWNGGIWGGGGGDFTSSVYDYGSYGGTYGGNGGGSFYQNAENGTNTIGKISSNLAGYGRGGGIAGGGGGHGGNGGNGSLYNNYVGGYGGGGGYGARGGNGCYNTSTGHILYASGGGGGYSTAGKGGNGFISGNYACGGGGGGYGPGGDNRTTPAYGGGGCFGKNGASGICIIEYTKI